MAGERYYSQPHKVLKDDGWQAVPAAWKKHRLPFFMQLLRLSLADGNIARACKNVEWAGRDLSEWRESLSEAIKDTPLHTLGLSAPTVALLDRRGVHWAYQVMGMKPSGIMAKHKLDMEIAVKVHRAIRRLEVRESKDERIRPGQTVCGVPGIPAQVEDIECI